VTAHKQIDASSETALASPTSSPPARAVTT
jgi:hypothetical protein